MSARAIGAAGPRISVVISTHNRAALLTTLAGALRRQTLNGKVSWEAIVVDNASTDGTAQTLNDISRDAGFPIIVAFEGRRGKSHGLNAGIALARSPIIAFTDDDGVPAPDWIELLLDHFDEHPDTECVGGRVTLHNPGDLPAMVLLSERAARVDASVFSAASIPVIGCNMAIRSSILKALGPYDAGIGPGSPAGVAEDVDMLYRLVAAGHCIDYNPHIVVQHNHGRQTAAQLTTVRNGYAMGRGAFYCKYILRGDRRVLRYAYWEARNLIGVMLKGAMVSPTARATQRHARLLLRGAYRYARWQRHPNPDERQ